MEITKREVIASITIIAVMMILGFVIAGKIDAYQIRKNSEYYKAIQITDPDQFRYCMDTSVGNAFVYGKLTLMRIMWRWKFIVLSQKTR